MKKIVSILLSLALASCISTTKITGSWYKPQETPHPYSSAFIAVFSGNTIAKSTLENHVAEFLNKNNVRTLKSISEFPPTFLSDTVDRKVLMSRVQDTQTECVLVITILKKENDYRFISGRGDVVYHPENHPHNTHLRDYYLYWQPCIYDPCYYVNTEIYYLETNVYDANTQELVWSAQSQTYTPEDLHAFVHSFASKIVKRLLKDKIMQPATGEKIAKK